MRQRRKPRGADTLPAVLQTFGQRIRAGRLRQGWTQQDLADRVGVTKQAVSEWERDQVGDVLQSHASRLQSLLELPLFR